VSSIDIRGIKKSELEKKKVYIIIDTLSIDLDEYIQPVFILQIGLQISSTFPYQRALNMEKE
jgi:hypothetical protein